jgi:hypothetical protein
MSLPPAPARRRRALAHACVACRKPWALRAVRNPDGVYLLICRFCSHRQVSGARAALPAPPRDHEVMFYNVDHDLVEHLAGYVEDGLRAGEACLVIATAEHRAALRERVGDEVLTAAAREGAFVELDAEDTLRLFLLDGMPDTVLFEGTLGEFVRDQAARGPVRAYGEMVSLLWAHGQRRSALALEGLWNQLRGSTGFSLLCAYPAADLDARGRADVCRTHSAMAA